GGGGVRVGVEAAVEGSLREFASAGALSRRHAVPRIFGEGQKGDPKHTFGRFLLAVKERDLKALEAMGSQFVAWEGDGEKKTAMSTQAGTSGGGLGPTHLPHHPPGPAPQKSIVPPPAPRHPLTPRAPPRPAHH